MNEYEVINPSDFCTVLADEDTIAWAAVLLLGGGAYGAQRVGVSGAPELPILAFSGQEAAEKWLEEHGIRQAIETRKPEIAACLESLVYGKRALLKTMLEMVPADKHAEVVDKWNDEHRSSLNDIAGRAKRLAQQFRADAGGK